MLSMHNSITSELLETSKQTRSFVQLEEKWLAVLADSLFAQGSNFEMYSKSKSSQLEADNINQSQFEWTVLSYWFL